jgi:hypothetical protein
MSKNTHGKNHNLLKITIFKKCDIRHVVKINSILILFMSKNTHGKNHKLSKNTTIKNII